jgi:regulator of replication initiation timing
VETFYFRKVVMSKLSNLNEPIKDEKLELIKELKSKIKEISKRNRDLELKVKRVKKSLGM